MYICIHTQNKLLPSYGIWILYCNFSHGMKMYLSWWKNRYMCLAGHIFLGAIPDQSQSCYTLTALSSFY